MSHFMSGLYDSMGDLSGGKISNDTVSCQEALVNAGQFCLEGGLLEVALCATEVSWFMTAKGTDTEYLAVVTICVYVHI